MFNFDVYHTTKWRPDTESVVFVGVLEKAKEASGGLEPWKGVEEVKFGSCGCACRKETRVGGIL